MWHLKNNHKSTNGEIILFKDNEIWHPYQNDIKAENINKVIFSGLSTYLKQNSKDIELLKAFSGFFEIGNKCYGGRINKV